MYSLSDFDYNLPPSLIAKFPTPDRTASHLLVCEKNKAFVDDRFANLAHYLRPGDLLIFNNTRVIPARLYGRKETGGAVECLIERITSEHEALVHLKFSKAPKPGSGLAFSQGKIQAKVLSREGDLFFLRFSGEGKLLELLEAHGEIPLPPYLERSPEKEDLMRYQTVYAKHPGAVAAPTAGLHFDNAMLQQLESAGICLAELTLHVGAGTFQPVRFNNLSEHVMHPEYVDVDDTLCQIVKKTKQSGGRVVAVGTTVVRSLEAASISGELQQFQGKTQLFITPGYRFQVVDALITNFHLPQSSLLMLVTAFGGYDRIMAAYAHAVRHSYRFFSYGDSMFIERA